MANPIRVLHLEDSDVDHALALQIFKKSATAFSVTRVEQLQEFQQALATKAFDVVIADYRLHGFTALDAWKLMQKAEFSCPFVIFSGAIGEEAAVEAIHLGVADFLHKDNAISLPRVLSKAIEVHKVRVAKDLAEQELAVSEKRITELAHHLQEALEIERAAIAREIHDDIGGALAAVKLEVAWIARRAVDEHDRQHLAAAKEMLDHALGASQRIMRNLRPAILDQGLEDAVRWLLLDFTKRTGIDSHSDIQIQHCVLPKETELTAFRTVQESLTNVSKYANCDSVKVVINDSGGVLTVEVNDNGKGLSPEDLKKSGSFGIRGLHERARTVGGWLDVTSVANESTSVILTVPTKAHAHTFDGSSFQ